MGFYGSQSMVVATWRDFRLLVWLLEVPESAPLRGDDLTACYVAASEAGKCVASGLAKERFASARDAYEMGPPEIYFKLSKSIKVFDLPLAFIGQA